MKLKAVDVCCGRFSVVEDQDDGYKMKFARSMDGGWKIVHLYQVDVLVVELPYKMLFKDTIFVLASSEEGAESQASCISTKEHETACRENVQNFCHAEKVELFGIRGWSGNTF